jgi:prepilin-type N-terminal cleavage/methylation domain-containing protein
MQNGFSLIEVLVSLALLTIIIQLSVETFHHLETQHQRMIVIYKNMGDKNINSQGENGSRP